MALIDFYQLNKIEPQGDNNYQAFIHINKNHDIFKGHFPDNPVVPGVCMLQIVKEIVAQILKAELSLKSSGNIKFMALINPEENPDLRLDLSLDKKSENEIQVKNTSYFGTTNAVKMSLNYTFKSL